MQNEALEQQREPRAIQLAEPTRLNQALLFADIEAIKAAEKAEGRYTADELREDRPMIYEAVTEQLAAGTGLRRIARMFGIHHRTAAAVRDREGETIDTLRSKMVAKLGTAADLQLDRLIENPESVPFNVAGLVISQLIDKQELLSGRATSRTEHTDRIDVHSDFEAFIRDQLPSEKQLDAGQVREIGSQAGEIPAIEAPTSTALDQVLEPRTDAESAVPIAAAAASAGEHPALHPDPCAAAAAAGAGPDARNRGAGGSFGAWGGPQQSIDTASRKFSSNGLSPEGDR